LILILTLQSHGTSNPQLEFVVPHPTEKETLYLSGSEYVPQSKNSPQTFHTITAAITLPGVFTSLTATKVHF
jgi:hypothetical protein